MQQTLVLRCLLGTKTWQNSRHKVAKFVLWAQIFFPAYQKFFFAKIFCTAKNSICTAKIAIIHTFSGFGTLSCWYAAVMKPV